MTTDEKTRISSGHAQAGVGTRLSGIYELDKRIASGGMGEVFRGHNIETGDEVAIKIVLPEFALDQMILSLFRKEASILNHLSHDAVVRYHVFTIDPEIGRPYLAMEFVDGEPLFEAMRRGPMERTDAATLCRRLASALGAVHQAGAIHRDLSPDNIILPAGRVERAKIIDFGIARSSTIGGGTLIGNNFAGKYNYVSPEQLGLFGGEVREQSDIYSLGLVIAAALLGKPIDMVGSQNEIMEKRRTVPDLAGIPADFQPILTAMLQPDPLDRPQSMETVALAMNGLGRNGETTRSVPAFGGEIDAAGSNYPTEAWVSAFPHADDPAVRPKSTAQPQFVAHEAAPRTGTRPAPRARSARPAQDERPPRSRLGFRLAAATAATVVILGTGAAIYASGYLYRPAEPKADKTEIATLTPEIAKPPETVATRTDGLAQPETAPNATSAGQSSKTTDIDRSAQPAQHDVVQPQSNAAQDKSVIKELAAPSGAETEVAIAIPEPSVPPSDAIDSVTDRISWLRDYQGGDCFYASVTSATDKDIDIEGFGTDAAPFERMLNAFQTSFGIEPDVSVRLIAPPQCEVTHLLNALDSGAEKPRLDLDRTSVKDGSTVIGQLETQAGLRSSLLLIDQTGMTSNLDPHVTVQSGKAVLSLPVRIGAKAKATDGPLPQIILVVTGLRDLRSAEIATPTPAAVVLPKILAEIAAHRPDFTVTAKYLRVSG